MRLLAALIFFVILATGTIGFVHDCIPVTSARLEGAGFGAWLSLVWSLPFDQPAKAADALYRSVQLFFLNFEACPKPAEAADAPYTADLPWQLESARFAAAAFSAATILSFLVPRFHRWTRIGWQVVFGHLGGNNRRAIVLGYGPVGQAVAAELAGQNRPAVRRRRESAPDGSAPRTTEGTAVSSIARKDPQPAVPLWRRGMHVTAIVERATQELQGRARRDGVVLVEGGPSDPAIHRVARIRRASCIVSAMEDDLATIDAMVSANASMGEDDCDLRAILRDPDFAAVMPDSAARGFLGAAGVRTFSLATEAARLLVAEARFDRVAIEAGQDRVHLAVLGCGTQGEAVGVETLLTSWRAELGPPRITVLDRQSSAIERRFRKRAPALFLRGRAALPEPARATLRFGEIDLETLDFGRETQLAHLASGSDPVTAWVIATGDDALNLRAAAVLHEAMMRGRVPMAPIHVRIWHGHQGDTPVLAARPVGVARPFGALESTIRESFACSHDPDRTPRDLHAAYLEEGKAMAEADPGFRFSDGPWERLPLTLRNANHRLHRHAVMKFEDLGGQWRRPRVRAVPIVDRRLRDSYLAVEENLDYAAHRTAMLKPEWWKREKWDVAENRFVANDYCPTGDDTAHAARLLATAIAEHNRWTVDRALDGWRKTARPDRSLRDDDARLHNNMFSWAGLDAATRRWDSILLRTLVRGAKGQDAAATAWKRRIHTVVLTANTVSEPRAGNVPGLAPDCRLLCVEPVPPGVTELRIVIAGGPTSPDTRAAWRSAREAFAAFLIEHELPARLCRIRFDFIARPDAGMLALANAIGSMVVTPPAPGWIRQRFSIFRLSRVERAAAHLAALEGIEVSATWPVPALRGTAPRLRRIYGIVGHRDLGQMGGEATLQTYMETFFARRLMEGAIETVVSGYAPGADRAAVNAWLAFGARKPILFFPYGAAHEVEGTGAPAARAYFTDCPARSGPRECLDARAIEDIADVRISVSDSLDPHVAQASDVLEHCDVLVAIYDGGAGNGPGGTADTVARARRQGKQVIQVFRSKGAWCNDDPDDPDAVRQG